MRLAAYRFPERWAEESVTVRDLAGLAAKGDADALAVLAETGRYLGRGLAILLDILNPEVPV